MNREKLYKRNRFLFGFGTLGRDMVYTLVSMFLMVYITEALKVSKGVLGAVSLILVLVGIFDACNDPFMGLIVDNTRTRWGKFKPWIVIGGFLSGLFTIFLFSDIFGTGTLYVVMFAVIYLLWTLSWTANDIAYWSMLPALSKDRGEREITSSVARIFANLGLFAVYIFIVPITNALTESSGKAPLAYTIFAVIAVVMAIITQTFTVFGVKEENFVSKEKSSIKDMLRAIFKNDQLFVCAIAMIPFAVGCATTISFGLHYFKYVFLDESMFSVFAVIVGVSQILAIAVFPLLCKVLKRKQIFALGMVLLAAGYVVFFFAPANIFILGIAAVLMFVGQAVIQILMLVCLTDTVEYGEYKLGKRNESVTFSLQSFISKISSALASGIVGLTLIISGISDAKIPTDVSTEGIWVLKTFMFIIPLLLIVTGFCIVFIKYKIDDKMYKKIVDELHRRHSEEKAAELSAQGNIDAELPASDESAGEIVQPLSVDAEGKTESAVAEDPAIQEK